MIHPHPRHREHSLDLLQHEVGLLFRGLWNLVGTRNHSKPAGKIQRLSIDENSVRKGAGRITRKVLTAHTTLTIIGRFEADECSLSRLYPSRAVPLLHLLVAAQHDHNADEVQYGRG